MDPPWTKYDERSKTGVKFMSNQVIKLSENAAKELKKLWQTLKLQYWCKSRC